MFTFLLVLLILDALILSVVVLLQAGQGGGLASLGGSGSTDTFVGGRQAVTLLTRASWWCGGIFLALSLMLSLVGRAGSGTSAIQERLRSSAPAPAPAPLPLNATPTAAPTADSGARAGAAVSPAPGAPAAAEKAPTPAPPPKDSAR